MCAHICTVKEKGTGTGEKKDSKKNDTTVIYCVYCKWLIIAKSGKELME